MDEYQPRAPLRVLWLGRFYPAFPADGAELYSSGLLRACAALGARISVICLNPLGTGSSPPAMSWENIDWTMIKAAFCPRLLRALHWRLPASAVTFYSWKYRKAVRDLVALGNWDAVVIDSISLGSYLGSIREKALNNSAIVLLAHNHEGSARMEQVWQASMPFYLKLALLQDGWKAQRLEAQVASQSDAVFAITQADAVRFRTEHRGKVVEIIPPGYSKLPAPPRDLANSARRVLVLGSYEWILKQRNLEAFLAVSYKRFTEAGIIVRVAGKVREPYRRKLERRYPGVECVCYPTSIEEQIQVARIGVVVDQLGGGFKLKVLDYVFGRLPIAALHSAMRDGLLQPDEHYLSAGTMEELLDTIVTSIDDAERLAAMADRAAHTFEDAFDWRDRGRRMLDTILSVRVGHAQLNRAPVRRSPR